MSMKLGDVKSAMFLLEKRFSEDGYGKQSQVNVNAKTESQNLNLNANASVSTSEADAIRKGILDKLSMPSYPPRLNVSPGRDQTWHISQD